MRTASILRRIRSIFPSAVLWASLFAAAAVAPPASALTLEITTPSLDYNSYVHTPSPGTRQTVQSFGAFGAANLNITDNRYSQAMFGFITSGAGGIPTGLALSNYQITSVTFQLTFTYSGGKIYDGTYDPISTYGSEGEQINGDDPGRPMELYGVGFRNGVTHGTFSESTPFTIGTQSGAGVRSAYASDFFMGASLNGSVRDVSNNLGGISGVTPFDPKPFAIGQVSAAELTNGFIDADATVTFTLDLTNADVLRYVQLSLQAGRLFFTESSLEPSSQTGATNFSRFYSKENPQGADIAPPAQLKIQYQIVPEPGTATLFLFGAAVFFSTTRRRRNLKQAQP